MRVNRKDPELNDAIEELDRHLSLAKGDIREAWARLSASELEWVTDQIDKCLDSDHFLQNFYTITTENGEIRTLYPYWDQQEIINEAMKEEWAENGCCKMIILKGRQFGGSTFIQGKMFHRTIFTPNCFTLIVAQNLEVSMHVQSMSRKALEHLPFWLKPELRYSTKSEGIEFQRLQEDEIALNPGLNSQFKISHAQKASGVAIGRSLRCLHASEVSRWPNPEIFEADMLPSMNALDGWYVLESTALGRNGLFHGFWQDSVSGDTGWRPVFVPTFMVRKYYLPLKKGEIITLSDTEEKFQERVKKEQNFDIPMEFWKFRHYGLRRAKSNKSGFLESYPITPEEAFQASGICAFDRESMEEQAMAAPKNPNYAGEISLVNGRPQLDVYDVSPNQELPFRKSGKKRRGAMNLERLWIWEMPVPGESYYVASDAASGAGGDYSAVEVWKAGKGSDPDIQVAEWNGWIAPKPFAYVVAALGYLYNGAEIANEYNGPGITTGDTLVDLDYPALYRPQHKDRVASTYTNWKHWVTSTKTRDLAISEMQDAVLTRSVVINSHDLLHEMDNFSSLDEGPGRKRFEGVDSPDDLCMSAMIGLYCLRETMKDMKSAPKNYGDRTEERDPTGKIWGAIPFKWQGPWVVRDPAMRPVPDGVFASKVEAENAIKGLKGYTVGPHYAFAAANPYVSPIHQSAPQGYLGSNMQFQAKRLLRVPDSEITPDLVTAFKEWKKTMQDTPTQESSAYDDNW